jgi:hypothetical protein
MTEPRDPRDKLLAATLDGDWADGPTSALALRAARSVRRRRALRKTLGAVAGAALFAAALFLIFRTGPAGDKAPKSEPLRGYTIISEEELLAALASRPALILPEETGAKKIVLLDR